MNPERAVDTQEESIRTGSPLEALLDLEFEAFCAREGDEDVSLEEVRKAMASIPGIMSQAIVEEERADRF